MQADSRRPAGTDIRLWWVNRIFPGAIYAFLLIFAMSLMMKSKVEDTIELFVVALAFFVFFEHYVCSYRLVLGGTSLLYVHGWPLRRFVRIRASELQSWRMGGGEGAARSVVASSRSGRTRAHRSCRSPASGRATSSASCDGCRSAAGRDEGNRRQPMSEIRSGVE